MLRLLLLSLFFSPKPAGATHLHAAPPGSGHLRVPSRRIQPGGIQGVPHNTGDLISAQRVPTQSRASFRRFSFRCCSFRSVSFHCVLFGSVPCSKFFYRFLAGAVQMLHQALAHPTSTKTYVTIVRGSGEAFVDRGWFTASVCSYISLSFVLCFSFFIFLFLSNHYFFSVVLFLVFRRRHNRVAEYTWVSSRVGRLRVLVCVRPEKHFVF